MLGAGIRIGAARPRQRLRVAAPAPFSTAQLGPAVLANWDARAAASLSLTGAAVDGWRDVVTGVTLAQATAARRPSYGATSWDGTLPALSFDGVLGTGLGDSLIAPNTALADRMWVFALVERSPNNQNDGAGSTIKTIMALSRPSDNLSSVFGFIRLNSDQAQTALRLSSWGGGELVSATGGMAKGTKGVIFANMGLQVRVNSREGIRAITSGSGTRADLCLGGLPGTEHSHGMFKIAEILVIDPRFLKADGADNQRWVIEGLLAHRWGIQANLPALHPFKAAPPKAADWTGNAREIATWGNSICAGFSPHINSVFAGELSVPPLFNGGEGGETSTAIRTRFDAANPRLHECIVPIGDMFTNGAGAGNPTTREHIDHMVSVVLAAGGRPIVLDHHVSNLDGYGFGGATRAIVDANNAYLKAAYPDYFLDISEFVYQLGAPGAPYDDPAQYALGKPPAAAMRDNVHYVAAVDVLVGRHIGTYIKAKGWDR